jgi:hypothetical protein
MKKGHTGDTVDEGRELVGVVAGGFEEPIETEIFRVIVPAASKKTRHSSKRAK